MGGLPEPKMAAVASSTPACPVVGGAPGHAFFPSPFWFCRWLQLEALREEQIISGRKKGGWEGAEAVTSLPLKKKPNVSKGMGNPQKVLAFA